VLRHRFSPAILALEARRLLTTFDVTSTADDGSVGTLRWAVQQVDVATSPSTIDFNLGPAPATITLSRGQLELSNTTEPTTITGPGAGLLQVSAMKAGRVIQIDPHVTASLSGLTITGGKTSGQGGGVDNAGMARLTAVTISGNSALYGGGLLSNGELALSDCTISGNSATIEGGGAWMDGSANVENCTIEGNTSADIGGGVFSRDSMFTMSDCTISGNSAQGGGGIYNQNQATVTGCTISGNSAQNNGGGLVTGTAGSSSLSACTINGNFARDGAGLENYSTTVLTNCTVSGNRASASGGGVSSSGTTTLLACTISGNFASVSGGGVYNHDFLDHKGMATLTDTILAGNLVLGGVAGDIAGTDAGAVTGSFNLIGSGGAGGVRGGVQGNIVLASLASLGLTPLGNFGGRTQTSALLPGSPALGAGTLINGIATDQRGEPLDVGVDIGAFQSQGFVLKAIAGTTPQAAPTGEAFGNPLAINVTARNAAEPVAGGILSFTITPGGSSDAGARLSSNTAIIGADQRAQVSATANAIEGTYVVSAFAGGGAAAAIIMLTNVRNNLIPLQFGGLTDQSIVFGTPMVTITGTLARGAQVPPPGETVAVTLGDMTQQALIGPGGIFTVSFRAADLAVSEPPFVVNYTYRSDGTFASASATSTVIVVQATPRVEVHAAGGTAVFGQAVTFVAAVTAIAVPGGSVTFLDGTTPIGTIPLDAAGQATLTFSSLGVGSHSIVASYSGDANFLAQMSGVFTESVERAGTELVLTRKAVLKKHKLVSVRLIAAVEPSAPGQGIPAGTLTFVVKKKTLARQSLKGGTATLAVKLTSLLNRAVKIVYSGDGDFQPSQAATPLFTRASLKSLA
jgi:hypothetical protein